MFCSQCGAPMGDTDRFCANCGAPNAAAPAGPSVPSQPQLEHRKGCLAQAFSDMTKERGVFKRVCQIGFLPALIGIVSVVVLFVPVVGGIAGAIGLLLAYIASVCGSGYGIEWGRDLVLGEKNGMDRPLLRSSSFGLGLFSSVITGVLSLVALIPVIGVVFSAFETAVIGTVGSCYYYDEGGLAASLIGSFGLLVLGIIVSAVLSVFFRMFAELTVMHFAVKGSVDDAFALKGVWKSFKHDKTKLFCAAILPELLVGIAINVIMWVLVSVFGAIAAARYVRMYDYAAPSGFGAIVSAGGLTLVVFLALAVFVGVFGEVFGKMLKYRAVGYWAKRYATEWTGDDADEAMTFVLPGENAPVAETVSEEVPSAEPEPFGGARAEDESAAAEISVLSSDALAGSADISGEQLAGDADDALEPEGDPSDSAADDEADGVGADETPEVDGGSNGGSDADDDEAAGNATDGMPAVEDDLDGGADADTTTLL